MENKKPKMIIFDYGNTLIYERELSLEKGFTELYKHIFKNPENINLKDFSKTGFLILDEIIDKALKNNIEFKHSAFLKSHFDVLNLEFNLPTVELETIFWEAMAPCHPMPNIKKLLSFLSDKKIRTAVISNISFSQTTLRQRINKYIPENKFEFIIASSEYGFRKPNKLLFEVAIKKAGLNPNEIWYCGDNLKADVLGSSSVGIKPVLFKHSKPCPYNNDSDTKVEFDFLRLTDWNELIELLNSL